MSDVAEAAGVTAAAVSYALSGKSGVSDEARARIIAIADRMGYRLNRTARGLRNGRSDVLGLLLADIANPFYPDIASGVLATAESNSFDLILSHVGDNAERQSAAARTMIERGCDGILFTSATDRDLDLLVELKKDQYPFVLIGRRVDGVDCDWVGIDDFAAGELVGRHVASLSLMDVAVIAGPKESSASRNRGDGIVFGLDDRVVLRREDQMWGPMTRASGRERAERILSGQPMPRAILCTNDLLALGVMDVCRERSLSVPGQVVVTGFDDLSFSSAGPLQLTTVSVPRNEMGRIGAAMLIDRISGDERPPRAVVLPADLEVRATSTP